MTSLSTMFTAMECECSLVGNLCFVNRFDGVPNLTCSLLLLFSDVASGALDHISSHLMVISLPMEENLDQVKQYPSLHHWQVNLHLTHLHLFLCLQLPRLFRDQLT